MFHDGQQNILGGCFISTSNGNINIANNPSLESMAFAKLQKNTVPGALHNSGEVSDPPKCHPGTRVDVLDVLITWALATIYTYPIKWLNGPAGAGKSAIMRSFAEMLAERGLLLASFFFFRSNAKRNNAKYLISTIAYQLCITVPPLQPWIARGIDLNPLLFEASLSVQIQTLIIDPFLCYFYDPKSTIITPFPRIILIDGLDECSGGETQREILQTLSEMVQAIPIPIAVVFASRPEHQIRSAFELGSVSKASSRTTLDNSFEPDRDIRHYYYVEFEEIRRTHSMGRYLGASWPPQDVIRTLVRNASGQFVYATTVTKFVKSTRHDPEARLQIILGQADRGSSKPFEQLDLLYTVIFRNLDQEILPGALRVLGLILTPSATGEQAHQSPKFMELLLGLPAGRVRLLLLELESLLTVREDTKAIDIHHTSLSDFLFDKSRAAYFFIDRGLVYADIASLCIKFCDPQVTTSYPILKSYLKGQLRISLQKATPTDDLRDVITSYDLGRLTNLPQRPGPTLGVLALQFLVGLKQSAYHDVDILFARQLRPVRRIINSKLIEHWLTAGHLEQSLLFVLLLALTSASPSLARSSLDYILFIGPGSAQTVSIIPDIRYTQDSGDGLFCTDEDWRSLASVILGVINLPNGLLHDRRWRESLTNVTLHLVLSISWKPDPGSRQSRLMEILPFLLNVSFVRNDLTAAIHQGERTASRNGLNLKSSELAVPLANYNQRAAGGLPSDVDVLETRSSGLMGKEKTHSYGVQPPPLTAPNLLGNPHTHDPGTKNNKATQRSSRRNSRPRLANGIPPQPPIESNPVRNTHDTGTKYNKGTFHHRRRKSKMHLGVGIPSQSPTESNLTGNNHDTGTKDRDTGRSCRRNSKMRLDGILSQPSIERNLTGNTRDVGAGNNKNTHRSSKRNLKMRADSIPSQPPIESNRVEKFRHTKLRKKNKSASRVIWRNSKMGPEFIPSQPSIECNPVEKFRHAMLRKNNRSSHTEGNSRPKEKTGTGFDAIQPQPSMEMEPKQVEEAHDTAEKNEESPHPVKKIFRELFSRG